MTRLESASPPSTAVAPSSFIAARKPDVSLASTMSSSEASRRVRTTRSNDVSNVASTPADDAVMRSSTSRMESEGSTAIVTPLMSKLPATTLCPSSSRGSFGPVPARAVSGFAVIGALSDTSTVKVSRCCSVPADRVTVRPLLNANSVPTGAFAANAMVSMRSPLPSSIRSFSGWLPPTVRVPELPTKNVSVEVPWSPL